MPTCVPIKDMKDTAAFTRVVEEANGPVTVTRNGYDAFVVMRPDDFDAMKQEAAKARLLERIARSEAEYAEGRYSDASGVVSSIRERYGL